MQMAATGTLSAVIDGIHWQRTEVRLFQFS
jgi:hypothetical protein